MPSRRQPHSGFRSGAARRGATWGRSSAGWSPDRWCRPG